MGYRIDSEGGFWTNEYGSHIENLRPLLEGETVVECEWDAENNRPVGVTMPAPPTPQNWSAFRLALAGSSAYRRIVGHNNETLSLLPLLTNLAFMIDTDPPKAIEFAYVWNQVSAIAEPTSEEIATLNGIAAANNVPLVLNELGLMG
jgi:hypothetical protein